MSRSRLEEIKWLEELKSKNHPYLEIIEQLVAMYHFVDESFLNSSIQYKRTVGDALSASIEKYKSQEEMAALLSALDKLNKEVDQKCTGMRNGVITGRLTIIQALLEMIHYLINEVEHFDPKANKKIELPSTQERAEFDRTKELTLLKFKIEKLEFNIDLYKKNLKVFDQAIPGEKKLALKKAATDIWLSIVSISNDLRVNRIDIMAMDIPDKKQAKKREELVERLDDLIFKVGKRDFEAIRPSAPPKPVQVETKEPEPAVLPPASEKEKRPFAALPEFVKSVLNKKKGPKPNLKLFNGYVKGISSAIDHYMKTVKKVNEGKAKWGDKKIQSDLIFTERSINGYATLLREMRERFLPQSKTNKAEFNRLMADSFAITTHQAFLALRARLERDEVGLEKYLPASRMKKDTWAQ